MNLTNGFPNGNGMDPLSWRQIRTNMERIAAISKLINEGDMLEILGDEFPDIAALIRDMLDILDDLAGRIGTITALVNNINVNTQPNNYKYDITYEFKIPSTIGLGNKPGFENLSHCLVQTVMTKSIAGNTNFKPYQLAIGNDMCQYYRYQTTAPNGNKIWGPWKKIQYGTQWLLKDTFPEDDEQEVGDYLVIPV